MAPLHGGRGAWIPERSSERIPNPACQAVARAEWFAADPRRLVPRLRHNRSEDCSRGAATGRVVLAFVTDLAQQVVPPSDVCGPLHPFRTTAVNHPQHPLTLLTPGHDDLDRVSGRTKDRADLRHVPDCAQYIDGIGILDHEHKRVPRTECL